MQLSISTLTPRIYVYADDLSLPGKIAQSNRLSYSLQLYSSLSKNPSRSFKSSKEVRPQSQDGSSFDENVLLTAFEPILLCCTADSEDISTAALETIDNLTYRNLPAIDVSPSTPYLFSRSSFTDAYSLSHSPHTPTVVRHTTD